MALGAHIGGESAGGHALAAPLVCPLGPAGRGGRAGVLQARVGLGLGAVDVQEPAYATARADDGALDQPGRHLLVGVSDLRVLQLPEAQLHQRVAGTLLEPRAGPDRATWGDEAGDPSMRPEGAPRAIPKQSWSRDTLIRGLAKAVRALNGDHLSTRALKEIARDRALDGIPSYSTAREYMKRHHPGETWEQWVTEAEALARQPGTLD